MPTFKPRFYLFAGVILFVIVIIAALASNASQPTTPKTTPTPTYPPTNTTPVPQLTTVSITVNSEVGIKQVTITNLDTGTSIIKRNIDLPFTFKATRNDNIRFNVLMEEHYMWNAWVFQNDTFDNHNPLTLEAKTNLVMSPTCLEQQEIPTE